MTKPTLIYFKARARAELIRVLLAEAGVDYHEHAVGKDTPPDGGRPTDFAALKATGDLPFEALPVWEEPDGFRLAQSNAIVTHLARSHGLHGKTPREAAECDQMLGAFDDLRGEMRKLVVAEPGARAALRADLESTIVPRWLGYLERLLVKNHGGETFLVGDGMTVADVALWYLLEVAADNGFTAQLAAHPRLVAYAKRIGARPGIAAWVSSPRRAAFVPFPR